MAFEDDVLPGRATSQPYGIRPPFLRPKAMRWNVGVHASTRVIIDIPSSSTFPAGGPSSAHSTCPPGQVAGWCPSSLTSPSAPSTWAATRSATRRPWPSDRSGGFRLRRLEDLVPRFDLGKERKKPRSAARIPKHKCVLFTGSMARSYYSFFLLVAMPFVPSSVLVTVPRPPPQHEFPVFQAGPRVCLGLLDANGRC